MRVFIRTYGCTTNQADSEIIAGRLEHDGHEVVDTPVDSDVIVVNSCTVKSATENKVVDRVKRYVDSGKLVVVAGCLPQANPNAIERISDRIPYLGPESISHISEKQICNS